MRDIETTPKLTRHFATPTPSDTVTCAPPSLDDYLDATQYAALARCIPALSQCLQTPSLQALQGGTHSQVFAFRLNPTTQYVLHVNTAADRSLVRQDVLNALAQAGLAPYCHFEIPPTISVTNFAPGERLDRWLRAHQPLSAPFFQAFTKASCHFLHQLAGLPPLQNTLGLQKRLQRNKDNVASIAPVLYPAAFAGWQKRVDAFAKLSDVAPQDYLRGHGDLNPTNVFVVDAQQHLSLQAIDWDFTGMMHPFDDLAVLAFHSDLDESQAAAFLSDYLATQPTALQLAQFYARRLIVTALMATWTLGEAYKRYNPETHRPPYAASPIDLDQRLADNALLPNAYGIYRTADGPSSAEDFFDIALARFKKLAQALESSTSTQHLQCLQQQSLCARRSPTSSGRAPWLGLGAAAR